MTKQRGSKGSVVHRCSSWPWCSPQPAPRVCSCACSQWSSLGSGGLHRPAPRIHACACSRTVPMSAAKAPCWARRQLVLSWAIRQRTSTRSCLRLIAVQIPWPPQVACSPCMLDAQAALGRNCIDATTLLCACFVVTAPAVQASRQRHRFCTAPRGLGACSFVLSCAPASSRRCLLSGACCPGVAAASPPLHHASWHEACSVVLSCAPASS